MGKINFFKKNRPSLIVLIPILVAAVECVPIIQSHFSSYWLMVVIVMTLAAGQMARLLAIFFTGCGIETEIRFIYRKMNKKKMKKYNFNTITYGWKKRIVHIGTQNTDI